MLAIKDRRDFARGNVARAVLLRAVLGTCRRLVIAAKPARFTLVFLVEPIFVELVDFVAQVLVGLAIATLVAMEMDITLLTGSSVLMDRLVTDRHFVIHSRMVVKGRMVVGGDLEVGDRLVVDGRLVVNDRLVVCGCLVVSGCLVADSAAANVATLF